MYTWWVKWKEGAKYFSVVPTDRTRGNRHKFQYVTFCLNTTKHFSTGQMLGQVAQRGSGVFITGGARKPARHSPKQLDAANPALSKRLDQMICKHSCQPWPFGDPEILEQELQFRRVSPLASQILFVCMGRVQQRNQLLGWSNLIQSKKETVTCLSLNLTWPRGLLTFACFDAYCDRRALITSAIGNLFEQWLGESKINVLKWHQV